MNDFVNFLEEVKKKNNLRFDTDLAKLLGISKGNLHRLMKGRGVPSNELCIQIASAVGCEPAYVLALAHKTAAKSPVELSAWDRLVRSLVKTESVFFYVLAGGWSMASGVTAAVSHLYIMSTSRCARLMRSAGMKDPVFVLIDVLIAFSLLAIGMIILPLYF